MFYDLLDTPIGTLALLASEEGLRQVIHCKTRPELVFAMKTKADYAPIKLTDISASVLAFLKGDIMHLDIPLDHSGGTELQQNVWAALQEIPYGERISYTELAGNVGKSRAVRAVASACGANPTPLVVPCHRVVSKDGGLGGFAWGLDKKEWLLNMEVEKRHAELMAA